MVDNPNVSIFNLQNIGAFISCIAAIISAFFAYIGYIKNKSDEKLIFSYLAHPDLDPLHENDTVILFDVFNKSKRKSTIRSIKVYNTEVVWENWTTS